MVDFEKKFDWKIMIEEHIIHWKGMKNTRYGAYFLFLICGRKIGLAITCEVKVPGPLTPYKVNLFGQMLSQNIFLKFSPEWTRPHPLLKTTPETQKLLAGHTMSKKDRTMRMISVKGWFSTTTGVFLNVNLIKVLATGQRYKESSALSSRWRNQFV